MQKVFCWLKYVCHTKILTCLLKKYTTQKENKGKFSKKVKILVQHIYVRITQLWTYISYFIDQISKRNTILYYNVVKKQISKRNAKLLDTLYSSVTTWWKISNHHSSHILPPVLSSSSSAKKTHNGIRGLTNLQLDIDLKKQIINQ